MSAQDQIRKMLDELMGTGRDGEVRHDLLYTDGRVCRAYLLGCCPHDILANTRMDMGLCSRLHDPALRADYEKAVKEGKVNFEFDAFQTLRRFFVDCDKKMEQAKKRLAETQEEMNAEVTEMADKVLELNEEIGKALAEAEKLGEEGKVEESLQLMQRVDDLRKQKQDADMEYRNSMPASSYQQQKLRVCDVCSAYLGIHDNDRRLADHFGGKLHMGFAFLREKFAALKESFENASNMRERRYEDRRSASENYSRVDRDRRGPAGSRPRSPEAIERENRRSQNDWKDRSGSYNRDRQRRSRSRSREPPKRHSGNRRYGEPEFRSYDRRRGRDRFRDKRRRSRSNSRDAPNPSDL